MISQPTVSQNADVRFLGKLLGEVIRSYGGESLFQRIESIRAASVDRFRGIANPRTLTAGLETLSLDETVAFVRSFMLFSMLANLAEDRQGGAANREDTMAAALAILRSQGLTAEQVVGQLNQTLITPVLTAHPTEVMRKSMLDHRNRISALMHMRDAGRTETPEGELVESAISGQIALLWQTRALRRERLYVTDEVDTALAYLKSIFLPVFPSLYARWERLLGERPRSFLRLGSWIGGDRDGNPHVTADSLRLALGRAAQTLLVDYLDQVNELGAELSISRELAEVSDEVAALADRSGDVTAGRADEPYRRAITGIYARLAATYQKFTRRGPPRPASVAAEPYIAAKEFLADLNVLEQSLRINSELALGSGDTLARLIRGVETFGFHLATLDLRQNADVHARVVGELLATAGVSSDYQSLDEAARVALLRRELASERLLASPYSSYSAEATSELAIVRATAEVHALYGSECVNTYIVSKCESVSDLLEVYILLKEAGLYRVRESPRSPIMAVPLF
jgi:phosphoenolpyruvate carboxylase